MSGDQAETQLLALEIPPAEEIEKIKILQITANPTKITVTANGLEIQSNLNPNATEFFPSYLHKNTPIIKENIDDKTIPENNINIEQEIVIKETDKKEEPKIQNCVGILDESQDVRNVDEGEQNKNIDDSLQVNIEKHQLCILFASDSGVKNTSSENVRSTSPPDGMKEKDNFDDITYKSNLKDKNIENEIEENDLNSTKKVLLAENIENINEIENLILENINENCNANPKIKDKVEENVQDSKTTLNDHCNANFEIKDKVEENVEHCKTNLNDGCNSSPEIKDKVTDGKTALNDDCNDIPEIKDRIEEAVENCNITLNDLPESKDKIDEHVQDCNTILAKKNEDEKETKLVYLFYKQNNTETGNIKKSNEAADIKEQSNVKVNISKELKDPKKKLNIISKISKPPTPTMATAGKISFSKIPKNVDPKKEINHKAETKVVQTSSLAKNFKTLSATKTNPPSRLSIQPPKKEVPKPISKDTTANKSACSAERSSSSTKSHLSQNSKVKIAEKPIGHGLKTKESISKPPRATVSSKLRKTETQKRRNLFFDLDTIKMSDFLFK